MKDRKTDNDGTNVNVSVLELGYASEQDELSEDEPVRVKKKHRWKTNKPKQSTVQKEPENVLNAESIKKTQREDQDICFIIQLLEFGAEKPLWTDIRLVIQKYAEKWYKVVLLSSIATTIRNNKMLFIVS